MLEPNQKRRRTMNPPQNPCNLTKQEIEALISQREQARMDKDYAKSDEMRTDMRASGVEVYDYHGIWMSGNNHVGIVPNDKPLGEDAIKFIIEARERMRTGKQWDEADNLRNLLKENGVQIFDRKNSWSCVDRNLSGPIKDDQPMTYDDHGSRGPPPPMMNMNRGGVGMGMGGGMFNNPVMHQPQQHNHGMQQFSNIQQHAPSKGHMTVELGQPVRIDQGYISINDILQRREECRAAKNFHHSDLLRDALRLCGIAVNDRSGRWSVENGPHGEIPGNRSIQDQ